MFTHNKNMQIQERDHWNMTALTHYEGANSDEDSAPGTPRSFDLEEVEGYESPATLPQLPTFEGLETGI